MFPPPSIIQSSNYPISFIPLVFSFDPARRRSPSGTVLTHLSNSLRSVLLSTLPSLCSCHAEVASHGVEVAIAPAAFSFSSTVSILATNPVTSEGDHTSPARFTLTRSGPTDASLAVNLLIGGTATPGTDYLTIPSPVTIPVGQATHEIVIFPYEGSLAEGAETITLLQSFC